MTMGITQGWSSGIETVTIVTLITVPTDSAVADDTDGLTDLVIEFTGLGGLGFTYTVPIVIIKSPTVGVLGQGHRQEPCK
jgi:hypothetical protein